MKIQHYAIIFIIIILPYSIVCRTNVNNKIDTISDEVRINHAIDTATYDAIDTIRDLNNEFYTIFNGQTIDITPEIAMEGINTFFNTMSINNTLPFVGDGTYNRNYFSSYIPAILVIAYDGFYVYSIEKNSAGIYEYTLSPKIPYTAEYRAADNSLWVVSYTLGNYISVYAPNGMYYKGTFTKNHLDDASEDFMTIKEALGVTSNSDVLDYLPNLTTDMSTIIYGLKVSNLIGLRNPPEFLTADNIIDGDYSIENTTSGEISPFHIERRRIITNLIISTLNEKMNNHNRYADMMGITYDFYLPEIDHDDWMNAVNDISIMAFVQGVPVGHNSYYNSYALGASRIIRTEYIYGTLKSSISQSLIDEYGDPGTGGEKGRIYHKRGCKLVVEPNYAILGASAGNVEEIFITKEDAALHGYYPCMICKP